MNIKYFLFFLFTVLFDNLCFSQKIFLDSNWKKTTFSNATYYRIIKKVGNKYCVKDYYISGSLQMQGVYADTELKNECGSFTYFDSNGNLVETGTFVNNEEVGEWRFYYSYLDSPANGNYALNVTKHKIITDYGGFRHIIINSSYGFPRIDFDKRICFDSSIFNEFISFKNARFHQRSCFWKARFNNSANFDSCVFNDTFLFSYAVCLKNIYFRKNIFKNVARFIHTEIHGDAYFNNTIFDSLAIFDGSQMLYADFRNNKWLRNLSFINAKIKEIAFFDSSIFFADAFFDKSSFYDDVYFTNCGFYYDVFFDYCFFRSEMRLDSSIVKGSLSFNECNFNGKVDFSNTQFGTSVDFSNSKFSDSTLLNFSDAILPDTLDFSYIETIPKEINLCLAKFTGNKYYDPMSGSYYKGKRHNISMYNSEITKLHLDYYHFKLLLVNADGSPLPSDEAKSVYEALLKNFKDRGQMDSYELLDLEYKDYIWAKQSKLYGWIGYVPKFWNNYGYEKGRIFGWTAVFLILLTINTFLRIDRLTRSVYAIEHVPLMPPFNKTLRRKSESRKALIIRRLWYSFIYTSAIFFLFSLKVERIKFKNRWGVAYLMFVYSLGIVCMTYMAGFVLQR